MFDLSMMDDFIEEITKWPEYALLAAEPAMMDALLYLHGSLPEYPDPPEHGVGFTSPAQRAWFFASVKDGRVPGWRWVPGQPATGSSQAVPGHPEKVGSARTGNLGRKFTEEVFRQPWAVLGNIGTNVPYAPWVVGPPYPGEQINGQTMYQARIHEGRWWQFEVTVESNSDEAWKRFNEKFWPAFQARLSGGK